MQIKPDHPVMTRHARLFELLRQETMALHSRARQRAEKPVEQDASIAFRKQAEQSFFQGRPTL